MGVQIVLEQIYVLVVVKDGNLGILTKMRGKGIEKDLFVDGKLVEDDEHFGADVGGEFLHIETLSVARLDDGFLHQDAVGVFHRLARDFVAVRKFVHGGEAVSRQERTVSDAPFHLLHDLFVDRMLCAAVDFDFHICSYSFIPVGSVRPAAS